MEPNGFKPNETIIIGTIEKNIKNQTKSNFRNL